MPSPHETRGFFTLGESSLREVFHEKIRLEPGPFVLPMPTVLIGATVNNVPNEEVSVHVDEAALKDSAPDGSRIAPLLFTFPDKGYWMLGAHVAEAWSVGKRYAP
jgi:hypothetical protein